jgi:DICT domain-containing protein/signal transduction histidine kinase
MSESLFTDLLRDLPYLQSQTYFKYSLTALSHALEDLVLAGEDAPLVIANFQQERFYRQEIQRYQQISQHTDQVYVLAAPESESGFSGDEAPYEVIPLAPSDVLTREWHLVIIGKRYSACLICREQPNATVSIDPMRSFEGFWNFDRQASVYAARLLLGRISVYRPELTEKIEQAWHQYGLTVGTEDQLFIPTAQSTDAGIFGQRLVTYLQSGQHQLLNAYQTIAAQEKRERLINTITTAIRNSLDPQAVLSTTIQELGKTFPGCRCLLYRCQPTDRQIVIEYEWVDPALPSLQGEHWPLTENALIQVAMSQNRAIAIADVAKAPYLQQNLALQAIVQRLQIRAYLLVPIRYQGALVGMIELHHGGMNAGTQAYEWQAHDISMVEAIATQAGFALTQAQTCADLETLNRQLSAIEHTQRNLIGIVGHELRTPLSTIQICLESIESEPDMPAEFLQTMLDMALTDSERMRKLVQNFLTLSRLETGTENLSLESIQIQEVVSLALNSIQSSLTKAVLPKITVVLPPELPMVRADGERLVKVLTELLENACKFTAPEDEITIQAQIRTGLQANEPMMRKGDSLGRRSHRSASDEPMLHETMLHETMVEVIVADTGRGVEPSQVEAIFEWFSQEEDFLRRTVGGVGLGLAICRQLIQGMGGKVWAESAGKNRGSKFHFTVPIELAPQYELLPA